MMTLPITLTNPAQTPEAKELQTREAAQALEAVFSKYLLAELEKSFASQSTMSGGNVYAGMFTQAIADQMAKSGSLGLSDQIYNSIKTLEKQHESPTTQPHS
jgi:Rod binding domain-containing protein